MVSGETWKNIHDQSRNAISEASLAVQTKSKRLLVGFLRLIEAQTETGGGATGFYCRVASCEVTIKVPPLRLRMLSRSRCRCEGVGAWGGSVVSHRGRKGGWGGQSVSRSVMLPKSKCTRVKCGGGGYIQSKT